MLENGIYLFGLTLAERVPLLVEMGVLLDVFVGVFIMGIVVFHINREFDSLDSAELTRAEGLMLLARAGPGPAARRARGLPGPLAGAALALAASAAPCVHLALWSRWRGGRGRPARSRLARVRSARPPRAHAGERAVPRPSRSTRWATCAASARAAGASSSSCLLGFLAAASLVALSHHFGLLWVGMEATTLAMAPLIYDRHDRRSLEAVWKYLVVCSVGIALALLGIVLPRHGAGRGRRRRAPPLMLEDLVAAAPRLHPAWLRRRSSSCWSASAPRWAWRRCTPGSRTPTARRPAARRRCSWRARSTLRVPGDPARAGR